MAIRTWTGLADDGNLWETPGNWDTGVPVTGDDAVIPDGMGTIAGTPSADVLGTVTVNGDSVLGVELKAANFVFNDAAYANGPLEGAATFNNGSSLGSSLTGNATFNDNSYNIGGTITGNATFTNTAQSTATTGRFNPQQGTVSGTIDFPNGCEFTLEDGETWTADTSGWTTTGLLKWVFNGSSSNQGILAGDADFLSSTSSNFPGTVGGNAYFGPNIAPLAGDIYTMLGTIIGDCELAFDATAIGGATTDPFSGISGTVTISGDLVVEYSGNNESFTGDTSAFVVTGSLEFVFSGETSFNAGIIVGNVTLSGPFAYNSLTITGYVTFSGSVSSNVNGFVIGTCDMVHPTAVHDGSVVDGTVIFRSVESVRASLLSPLNKPFDTTTYTPTLVFPFADVLGTGLL